MLEADPNLFISRTEHPGPKTGPPVSHCETPTTPSLCLIFLTWTIAVLVTCTAGVGEGRPEQVGFVLDTPGWSGVSPCSLPGAKLV